MRLYHQDFEEIVHGSSESFERLDDTQTDTTTNHEEIAYLSENKGGSTVGKKFSSIERSALL